MKLTCDWVRCNREAKKKVVIEVPEQITLYLCYLHFFRTLITNYSKIKDLDNIPVFRKVLPVD